MKVTRRLLRVGLSVATLVVVAPLAELVLRSTDGFSLAGWSLRPVVAAPRGSDPVAAHPVAALRLAASAPQDGIRPEWFAEDPPPLLPIALTGVLQARHDRYRRDPDAAFFEWNINYLRQQACADHLPDVLKTVDDYLFFTPPDQSPYPTYRHSRHATPPGWFTSNTFGWRGRDVPLNKPPQTIRIAFVGASTTIGDYAFPYSHPEMIEHWLNLWGRERGWPYRFEAINAGRTGVDSHSIAAVVRQELLPVEPDLVVYYEGANQFWPADHFKYHLGRLYPKPRVTLQPRLGESHSAVVRRMWQALDRWDGGDGQEPLKPPQHVDWPAGVDEFNPDPHDQRLPLQLPAIVRDLDAIRGDLQGIGSVLVLSSFIWMAEDGLRLDMRRDAGLYRYLNDTYWPASYANIRRFADFQNRVFDRYAALHHIPFIDISAEFPRDPGLFADAIHLRYEGLRDQAWLYFEELVPVLEQRIRSRMLPRAPLVVRDHHPAFDPPDPRTTTLEALRASCH